MALDVPGHRDRIWNSGQTTDDRAISAEVARQLMASGVASQVTEAVREALEADGRFLVYGENGCLMVTLAPPLPEVTDQQLNDAAAALPDQLVDHRLSTRTTEELVDVAWLADDDADEVLRRIRRLALQQALADRVDMVVDLHGHWASRRAWNEFLARGGDPNSVRQPTTIELPHGVSAATSDTVRETQREEGEDPETPVVAGDATAAATFTLLSRHVWGGWLPINRSVERMLPVRQSEGWPLKLVAHVGGAPVELEGVVDTVGRRIVITPPEALQDLLREANWYPGARMRLWALNEERYQLGVTPVEPAQLLRVWRIWLKGDRLESACDMQPVDYKIDQDAFVSAAGREDPEALIVQALGASNSIFGLMYAHAVALWERQDRQPLYVRPDELFAALQGDPAMRMTSPATIAWELWRRLAFQGQGDGSYLFRPEYGVHQRYRVAARRGPGPGPEDPPPPPPEVLETIRQLDPYLLGALLGRAEVFRDLGHINITYECGVFRNPVTGEAMDTPRVLEEGVQQVLARLRESVAGVTGLEVDVTPEKDAQDTKRVIVLRIGPGWMPALSLLVESHPCRLAVLQDLADQDQETVTGVLQGFADNRGRVTKDEAKDVMLHILPGRAQQEQPEHELGDGLRLTQTNFETGRESMALCALFQRCLRIPVRRLMWRTWDVKHDRPNAKEFQLHLAPADYLPLAFRMPFLQEWLLDAVRAVPGRMAMTCPGICARRDKLDPRGFREVCAWAGCEAAQRVLAEAGK
jgi:hypothetical protein